MSVIPLTFIELLIWMIFILVDSDTYQLLLRIMGSFWGFFVGLDCLGGIQWIIIPSTCSSASCFVTVNYDPVFISGAGTGISTILAVFLMFGSGFMAYLAIANYSRYRRKFGITGWRLG